MDIQSLKRLQNKEKDLKYKELLKQFTADVQKFACGGQ
jgi:HPt (histidine-containing phosphotransfer) domain-containing protein